MKRIDPTELEDKADAVAHRFKLMAHRERLLMLCRMGDGEVSVTPLVQLTGLSPSSVSQHLALLRKAGVVSVRGEAQRRLYRLSDRVVGGLVRAFCRGFADVPAKAAGEHSTRTFPHTTASDRRSAESQATTIVRGQRRWARQP